MMVHHGGYFSKAPGREYIKGKINYFDLVDCDDLSVLEVDNMMLELGYDGEEAMYYHFMKPKTDLDFGLEPLGNDQDILNLLKYTTRYKLIKLYIEHGFTTLTTYFKTPKFNEVFIEEIIGEGPREVNTSGKTSTCNKRLCLEWYGTGEEVVGPIIGEHGPVIGEHEVGDTSEVAIEKIPKHGHVMGE